LMVAAEGPCMLSPNPTFPPISSHLLLPATSSWWHAVGGGRLRGGNIWGMGRTKMLVCRYLALQIGVSSDLEFRACEQPWF
ncbi:unnamed protein product, partial [Closterium sp. Naga37s-1]